jgi:hypothetical protein
VGVELKTKGDDENKDKITFLRSSFSCETFNLVTSTFHWHLNKIEQLNVRMSFNFVRCRVSTRYEIDFRLKVVAGMTGKLMQGTRAMVENICI